jgi:PAS domain S-box-containing protein
MPDRETFADVSADDAAGVDGYERFYVRAAIGIFRSTPDGRFVAANPAGVRMHGYANEAELLSAVDNIADEIYIDPKDRERLRQRLEMDGSVEGFECEIFRHKSRQRVWVRQNIYPVFDSTGWLRYLEGYVEDITDRKRLEAELTQAHGRLESLIEERTRQLRELNALLENKIAELEKSEEVTRTRESWLSAILENAPIEIAIKDTEGRIVAISHNVAEQQNVPLESIYGTTTADYLEPESAEIYMAADRKVVETGEPIQQEVHEIYEGREYYFLNQKFPMRDRDGVIRGVCSLTNDITDIKQTEARLAQAQKMEAVGQLTGGVAHDFNNLLAVIMGNAELLFDRLGESDRQLQAIIYASARGAELTQRLLAFSRRQPLRPQAIDMAVLLAGLNDLLTSAIGETITMDTSLDPDLWAAWADQGQVESALLNLAINARDAMPGGGQLSIACRNVHLDEVFVAGNPETQVGDYVELSLTDNGTGMSAETMSQAFEPFFTTKEVGQGSGLGLSMVYGFAKQSGGHVTIDSEVDCGTTVRLYLPRSEVSEPAEHSVSDAPMQRGQGKTVLVIEDDPEVRNLAITMLRSLDYHAIEVADAAQARVVLDQHPQVKLILSDVVLPGGTSGSAFADEVGRRYPHLPVVLMSGYPADADSQSNAPASSRVLLNKPFHKAQLAKVIHEIMNRKSSG